MTIPTATVKMTIHMQPLPNPVIDDARIAQWIENRLNDARNTFIRNVSRGAGGGRMYGSHKASAPGEYPVTDTGRLVNSVDYQMTGPREGKLISDIVYAAYLTSGTFKMAPRKMLVEALEEALDARPHEEELARAVYYRVEND